MRKRLVVREDDVGYTLAFDLGAFRAIDEGIVTAADVMLDSPHTVEALKWLRERPWISIGWHRHLWESPVLPPEEVPSLVDEEGRFKWRHRHPELKKEATYEDAYKELKAELELCKEVYGRVPDTASVHEDGSELERAMADVCREYDLNVNIVRPEKGYPALMQQNEKFKDIKYYSAIKILSANLPNGQDSVYDLSCFNDYQPARMIKNITWDEDDEIYITGGHPGYLDDHILAESRCTLHRCRELQMCIDPEVKQWIIDNKIELVNNRDVIYGTSEYQDHLKEINSPLWIGNMK